MGGSNGTMSGSTGTELVLVGADNGVAVVSSDTPLRRLNYFDGKFLRAEHMRAEQEYLRFLVRTSNRAGGSGIVNGFDTVLAGGGALVTVGQGLALDAQGRVLLLSGAKTLNLDDIIAASNAMAPGSIATAAGSADFSDCVVTSAPTVTTSGQTADLYLLAVGFLEALCGEEDVFGKLCEAACVQSKDRPWRMEGVLFRAVPLLLKTLLQVSKSVPVRDNQLRSRVASAYFADERAAIASLISGVNIKGSDVWCLGAAAEIGNAVPLAVFSRSGGQTHFLDAWTARREHIETPARRYWAWRFSMRPWDVFLAQVLQFQCQLHEILSGLSDGGPGSDPCAPKTAAIGKATDLLDKLETWHKELTAVLTPELALKVRPFDITAITGLKSDLGKLTIPTPPSTRILIDGGILELPSAGYLPINVGGSTVNQQVRNFMGPGVDLRFCLCRPDYIPHVLEEAQHMERISLLDGIDDPKRMPHVDVFVPNGETAKTVDQTSRYFDLFLFEPIHFPSLFGKRVDGPATEGPVEEGAARWAPFGNGGQQFYWAGTSRLFQETGGAPARTDPPAGWIEVTLDRDPFALAGPSQFASIYARLIDLAPGHISVRLSNLRFTPDGPATAPPGKPDELVIKGLLMGTSVYTEQPSLGEPGGPRTVPVQLRRLTRANGGRITVEPPNPGGGLSLYWDWIAGSALTGSLYLTKPATDDIKLLEVKEDPDAQNPSNTFHSLSELAIPALQKKLAAGSVKDTGFAIYAEQALFPPPDPKSSLDIIAMLDWVLFARRRECSCDREAFAPPVADKKFQVYWVDADKGLDVLKLLLSNNSTDIGNVMNLVKPIDVVTYPGTSSALRDASVAVAEAKTKLGENTVLRGGLIGQQPPQDDDALEQARLQSYATALQGFMSLDAKSEFKTIPFMPPAFIDPNVSGAILIGVSRPVPPEVIKTELIILAQMRGEGHSIEREMPSAVVRFSENKPRDAIEVGKLQEFVNAAKQFPRASANRFTVASTSADAGTEARAKVILDALGDRAAGARRTLLSANDKAAIAAATLSLAGIDDVIFVEFLG